LQPYFQPNFSYKQTSVAKDTTHTNLITSLKNRLIIRLTKINLKTNRKFHCYITDFFVKGFEKSFLLKDYGLISLPLYSRDKSLTILRPRNLSREKNVRGILVTNIPDISKCALKFRKLENVNISLPEGNVQFVCIKFIINKKEINHVKTTTR
jgi:hypothetical protein